MARSRSPHFELNRDAIKRAAARLFAHQGYPGTSMADLARACGVSKPLLYHYVDDKYQLLLEITEGHVLRLQAIVAAIQPDPTDPSVALRQLIADFLQEYILSRDEHGVLTQDVKFLTETDRERVLDIEREIVAAFARKVSAVRPDLAQASLEQPLTMLLFGMINWMFTWFQPTGALGPAQMSPIVADLFLGGLGAVQLPSPSAKPASAQATRSPSVHA
jgi:AcrR family transcriptional regulator